MRLNTVLFDGDEQPESFVVTMSMDELALLYRFAGHISPARIRELSGSERWTEALFGLAECAGNTFNMFFENGVNDVIPVFSPYVTEDDT